MRAGIRENAYRAAAAEGASQIGLLVLVYAAIAQDLRRAGDALAASDIAARCDATNHALALLGHVQSWEFDATGSALSENLQLFYSYLRAQLLQLQAAGGANDFYQLAAIVLDVQATWQQHEQELLRSLQREPEAQEGAWETSSPTSPARLSFQV